MLCQKCGKRLKNKQKRFCSHSCCCKWINININKKARQKRGVIKKCLFCDRKIYVIPALIKIKRFCSIKCNNKYRWKNGFSWKKSKKEENHNRWKGGIGCGYIREKALLSLNGVIEKCELCGNKKKLVIHHIDRNRQNNKRKNLIEL